MTLGALSQAWVSAEAALPLGWQIMGLYRDAGGEGWIAFAQGPEPPSAMVTGRGDEPVQALQRLGDALRELPSPGDM